MQSSCERAHYPASPETLVLLSLRQASRVFEESICERRGSQPHMSWLLSLQLVTGPASIQTRIPPSKAGLPSKCFGGSGLWGFWRRCLGGGRGWWGIQPVDECGRQEHGAVIGEVDPIRSTKTHGSAVGSGLKLAIPSRFVSNIWQRVPPGCLRSFANYGISDAVDYRGLLVVLG